MTTPQYLFCVECAHPHRDDQRVLCGEGALDRCCPECGGTWVSSAKRLAFYREWEVGGERRECVQF